MPVTQEQYQAQSKRLKALKSVEVAVSDLHEQMKDLASTVVNYENDIRGLESEKREKKEELAEIERQIQRKKLERDSSDLAVRDELDRRHQELIEREAKIAAKEQAVLEMTSQASEILSKSEKVSKSKKEAVSA